MTRREKHAWAAGFFDGEGCARFGTTGRKRSYFRVTCSLSQRNRKLLARFKATIGCGTIYGPYQYPRNNNSKPAYLWMVSGIHETKRLARKLWPALGHIKRKQFSIAIKRAATYSRRTGRKV